MSQVKMWQNPKRRHVMIDLETLGVNPGCQILTVGAVAFSEEDGILESFYDRCEQDTRFIWEPDTVRWWERQSPDIRDEAFGGTRSVKAVLDSLAAFIISNHEPKVWGNAASFDLKILEAAYKIVQIPRPWHFGNEMCFRTLKNLGIAIDLPPPNQRPHHALHDARDQAELAVDYLRALRRLA